MITSCLPNMSANRSFPQIVWMIAKKRLKLRLNYIQAKLDLEFVSVKAQANVQKSVSLFNRKIKMLMNGINVIYTDPKHQRPPFTNSIMFYTSGKTIGST